MLHEAPDKVNDAKAELDRLTSHANAATKTQLDLLTFSETKGFFDELSKSGPGLADALKGLTPEEFRRRVDEWYRYTSWESLKEEYQRDQLLSITQ